MCEYLKSMTAHRRTINIDPVESSSIGSIPPKAKENTVAGRLINDQSAQGSHISASTHFFLPPSEEGVEKTKLREAIEKLRDVSLVDAVWLLQFENGEGRLEGAFRDLAFCIAAISNSYAVSIASLYILMSPFEYTHLESLCTVRDNIKATVYKRVEMGHLPQPLDFGSIAISLGFDKSLKFKRIVLSRNQRWVKIDNLVSRQPISKSPAKGFQAKLTANRDRQVVTTQTAKY
uniref:AlNc14C242G9497 protein n=1 Tax=Albugo laibachii Nc14 TaxID=890382 RepID=F0WT07_9STRA|nr:AlNc14C242G9497 [Albugo laibachii Nc14]|eukprot:CCA24492.1 AlNc14C242G9497 [Albugo laibachii Nc14]